LKIAHQMLWNADVRLAPVKEISDLAPIGYPAAGFAFLSLFAAPISESTRSIILVKSSISAGAPAVCTENFIRVDDASESPKLAE